MLCEACLLRYCAKYGLGRGGKRWGGEHLGYNQLTNGKCVAVPKTPCLPPSRTLFLGARADLNVIVISNDNTFFHHESLDIVSSAQRRLSRGKGGGVGI